MWLRLQKYPDGSWSLGRETIFAGFREWNFWLTISNDEEWKEIGISNLCAIISAQKEQLRAIEAAKLIVEQRRDEVEEITRAFSAAEEFLHETSESLRRIESLSKYDSLGKVFQEDRLKDVVREKWYKNERDKRIGEVYWVADSYDFQKIAEGYTAVIQEIKTGIAHLEGIYDSVRLVQDEHDAPPVVPWLRMKSHFKKGDKIIGWKPSNEWSPLCFDTQHFWDPLPDILLFGSEESDKVWPRSGFLDNGKEGYSFYSPNIMHVEEAQFYQSHDSYCQFLMERISRNNDRTFHVILASIGRLDYPIKWRARYC